MRGCTFLRQLEWYRANASLEFPEDAFFYFQTTVFIKKKREVYNYEQHKQEIQKNREWSPF